jgi:hypothetical protein
MSKSGQLGLRCTVEPNCRGLSARLACASVTHDRALDTCEASCVPGQLGPSLFLWCTARWGRGVRGSTGALLLGRRGRGHVAASEPTSAGRRGPELRNMWQHWSSPLGEAEPGAMGHVAAPEPTSTGRRGPELRNVWRRQSSTQQGDEARGHGPRGSIRAHLSKEVRSGAAGHVVAPEPTSAGRCGLKLQLAWQRVNAHSTPCLNLEHVCGGTQSSGCRQRPRGPTSGEAANPQVGPIFRRPAQLTYLFTRQSMTRPPSM